MGVRQAGGRTAHPGSALGPRVGGHLELLWVRITVTVTLRVTEWSSYEPSCAITVSPCVQGNSNSIATVDISAGFVGLDAYMEIPAMFLTAFATYTGPVLWASHLVNFLSSETSR